MSDTDQNAHIEPSRHSTRQVDRFLDRTEQRVDLNPGAGAPVTKPQPLDGSGKPASADQPQTALDDAARG